MISTLLLHSLLSLSSPDPGWDDDIVVPPSLEIGVPPKSCDDSAFCEANYPSSPYCDPDLMECVQCIDDAHCDPGWTCQPGGYCVDACVTDEDCDGVGGLSTCDPATGTCVGCLTSDDCTADEYCFDRFCFPDFCTPGESLCMGVNVVTCLDDGGNTTVTQECPDGCIVLGGVPQCDGPASTTGQGGSGDDTGMPGGGSVGPDTDEDGGPNPAGSDGTSNGPATEDGGPSRDTCACRSDAPSRGGLPWLGLLLLGVLRRRRGLG